MPTPIICASQALCQFLVAFRGVFSKPQFKYLETVLLALMQVEDRRTLSGMLHKVQTGVTLAGLSRFFSVSPWSEAALGEEWQARFRQQQQASVQYAHQHQRQERGTGRGRPKTTLVTGFLIMDDSTHAKPYAKTMRGLGRHHSSTQGKRVSGHSLFQALYVLLDRRCPLLPRMYRTKNVCEAQAVPFVSKVEMAVACVQTFVPAPDTHTHVLVDAWYLNKALWKAAKQRGFDLSGGIACNRSLRVTDAQGSKIWQKLSVYVAAIPNEQFEKVVWPSDAGGQVLWVHRRRTLVRKLGACQVLCVKRQLDDPPHKTTFYVSSLVDADTPTLVAVLAIRWHIETFFADVKELFGTDHYQMMSDHAVVRFWTLACLAYVFLEEQRAALPKLRVENRQQSVSIGQMRRRIQSQHQNNLLQWVFDHYQQGATPEQVQLLLAA